MNQPQNQELNNLNQTNAAEAENNNGAIKNNRGRGKKSEWTLKEKVLLVRMEIEERKRRSGFMKRVKERWMREAQTKKNVSAQNLVDNARRFKMEEEIISYVKGRPERIESTLQENCIWTTTKNVRLVEIHIEKRQRGPWYYEKNRQQMGARVWLEAEGPNA